MPQIDPKVMQRECQTLVRAGTVAVIVEGLSNRLFNEWMASADVEAREAVYRRAMGLNELMTMIQNIAEPQKETPDEDA